MHHFPLEASFTSTASQEIGCFFIFTSFYTVDTNRGRRVYKQDIWSDVAVIKKHCFVRRIFFSKMNLKYETFFSPFVPIHSVDAFSRSRASARKRKALNGRVGQQPLTGPVNCHDEASWLSFYCHLSSLSCDTEGPCWPPPPHLWSASRCCCCCCCSTRGVGSRVRPSGNLVGGVCSL